MVLDDFLEKIDNDLKDKKESEVYAIVFLVGAGIAALSYFLLFEMSETMLQTSQTARDNMVKAVNVEKTYLEGQTTNGDQRFKVKQQERKLKKLKNDIEMLQRDIKYITIELNKLRYLLYDEQNWSKFLDSISKLAGSHKLNIIFIKSKVYPLDKKVKEMKQVLDIEVEVTGDYKNIIKLINDLEKSDIVTDVYNFEFENDKELKAIIRISVWGLIY